jgi:hypothetical protein
MNGTAQPVRLEPSYWEALDEICRREELTVDELCTDLRERLAEQTKRLPDRSDADRVSLANAIRVFTVGYFRQAATETGHDRAGHGRGDPFTATSGPDEMVTVRH